MRRAISKEEVEKLARKRWEMEKVWKEQMKPLKALNQNWKVQNRNQIIKLREKGGHSASDFERRQGSFY